MYRVIAVLAGACALTACSSTNLDIFKSGPTMETIRFESEPPGAEARVSNGQTCRTPCALALAQQEGGYSVTFTLNGFLPASEQLELQGQGDGSSKLSPNPIVVQLAPAAPPPKPKKAIKKKGVAAKKKKAAPKAAPPPGAAPPPAAATPPPAAAAPPPAAASPWPASPSPAR